MNNTQDNNLDNQDLESENLELNPNTEEDLSLEELHVKLRSLQSELLAAENKAANNWDLLLRAKAEEENLKRRFKLDLESAHKYAVEKLAKNMLNVVDSLEMGLDSAAKVPEEANLAAITSLKEGMQLTLKLLLDNLEDFGIKMLDPLGGQFNPVQHEAISIQPQEGTTPNTVITVVQKGFMINERILRPARVIVAK